MELRIVNFSPRTHSQNMVQFKCAMFWCHAWTKVRSCTTTWYKIISIQSISVLHGFVPHHESDQTLDDKGVPSNGGAGTVELTNLVNYSQLGAFPTPGYTSENLPPAKDIAFGGIFSLGLERMVGFLRHLPTTPNVGYSLSAPVSCQENCLEYLDLFNATWFNFGNLYCMQSYPEPGFASLQSAVPPKGNVNMILTNQCSQYTYGPGEGVDLVTMYTLTDTWGNVYALQSSVTNSTTAEEWESLLASAEYPDGWTISSQNLTASQTHYT